jgi:hypothetical protein
VNAKLPIGLVVAIVGQAMGLAFWISGLQSDVTTANVAAAAAQGEVARMEEVVQEMKTDVAVLRDQQREINAAHEQFGEAFDEVWEAVGAFGPDPAPIEVKRKYDY